MSDTQFSRGSRMAAMDAALPHLREAAQAIARELSQQSTGPFSRHLQRTVEDGFLSSVFDADLPPWGEWHQRAEEESCWEEFDLRRQLGGAA